MCVTLSHRPPKPMSAALCPLCLFILALSSTILWSQGTYSNCTYPLLKSPTLQPQRQVFRYTLLHSDGFNAKQRHLLDDIAMEQLTNTSAVLCATQARYWNNGCGEYKFWWCFFKSVICYVEGRTVNKHKNLYIRFNNGENDDVNRNSRQLSKFHG